MPIYARHCPTRRFTKEEWEAMPWLSPGGIGIEGRFARGLDSERKAFVAHIGPMTEQGMKVSHFRPIIRVKARGVPAPRLRPKFEPEFEPIRPRGIYRGLTQADIDWMQH